MELDLAFDIAFKAHKGQVDKAGADYIGHPARMAGMLEAPFHKAVALLHDVVEDTKLDFDDLFAMGVIPEVITTLRFLTREEGEAYDVYIDRIATDLDATIVKMADLRDNMDLCRLPALTTKDLSRTQRYHKAFIRLRTALKKHIKEEEDSNGTKQ